MSRHDTSLSTLPEVMGITILCGVLITYFAGIYYHWIVIVAALWVQTVTARRIDEGKPLHKMPESWQKKRRSGRSSHGYGRHRGRRGGRP